MAAVSEDTKRRARPADDADDVEDVAPRRKRRRDDDEADEPTGEQTSLWAGLGVGLSIACFVGLAGVVLYLLLKRRDDDNGLIGSAPSAGPPVFIFPGVTGIPGLGGVDDMVPGRVLQPATTVAAPAMIPMRSDAGVSYATTMRTYRLSGSQAARMFTAVGKSRWRVEVRTVGPPGSFAVVSTDPTQLRGAAMPIGNDILVIPVGESNVLKLHPGDVLYAKGNIDGVCVSVAASEDGAA